MDIKHQIDDEVHWMTVAIQLAKASMYTTHSNPRVGCVIVRNGKLVSDGFHLSPGFPHAEINALNEAPDNVEGATCYVTLEPCSDKGRTGPCAVALVKAGIKRVVYGMEDPNPLVTGKGNAILRAAGIEVQLSTLSDEVAKLNPGFIKRMQTNKPYVRAKLAISLDGNIATSNGESKWITSTLSRQDVQRLRAQSSAIIIGSNTVREDDPFLNVRDFDALGISHDNHLQVKQPLRVIIDSKAVTEPTIKMLKLSGETILATCSTDAEKQERWEYEGGTWLHLPSVNGKVNLSSLLDHLGLLECNEVLVESGGELCSVFTEQELIDEYVIYMAPKILGHQAKPMLTLNNALRLKDHIKVSFNEVIPLAGDLKICAAIIQNTANDVEEKNDD